MLWTSESQRRTLWQVHNYVISHLFHTFVRLSPCSLLCRIVWQVRAHFIWHIFLNTTSDVFEVTLHFSSLAKLLYRVIDVSSYIIHQFYVYFSWSKWLTWPRRTLFSPCLSVCLQNISKLHSQMPMKFGEKVICIWNLCSCSFQNVRFKAFILLNIQIF